MNDALSSREAPSAGATSSHSRLGWLAIAMRFALSNLPFALALGLDGMLPPFIEALVVGSILFLVPGLALTDWRKGDACVVLFRAIVASLIASLVVWCVLVPLGGPTNRTAFLLLLALLTNAGLCIGMLKGWYRAEPFSAPLPRLLTAVACLFFIQSYLGAAYFVPVLEDQDMETQGTAYGIMHEFTPSMTTNRGTDYFFAHPLLLHFWIGESALISNDLDQLRYYHESSLAGRAAPESRDKLFELELKRFGTDPLLLQTRTPNLFLGAFLMFPLGFLAYRLSGSLAAAVLTSVLYMTLPEVYVRTSYGGYMAVTNFLVTAGAYFYLQASGLLANRGGIAQDPGRALRLGSGASFLSAWSDQKGILLPMATTVHAGLCFLLDGGLSDLFRRLRKRPEVVAAFLIGLAFVAGWATFALYGLIVAPDAFIEDHIKGHIVRRLRMDAIDLVGYDSTRWYPSAEALWLQFFSHSGWLLVPPAALAMWAAARKIRQAEGMLFVWAAIGAIGFSLVDWRQTKHLAHILPAVAVLTAVYWASLEGKLKMAVSLLLGAAVLWNLWRIGLLMQDFSYLQPTPIW